MESSEVLLNTMFPGCQLSSNSNWPQYNLHRPSRDDWMVASKVVDDAKVTWAINTFSPYKSPGLDGVFPAMLQKALGSIRESLVSIFRACIAYRYIPKEWREVKVIFIPKPGRLDYSLAKSYRPISLTSFLLKGLERLCDRYIRDCVLLQRLHPSQHAYTLGRSTETALHNMASRIERSMDMKMSTLGVFIDIEGAFDKTTFDGVEYALRGYGVPPTLVGWIRHMLEWRAVRINLGNMELRGLVTKGCPQGGVLSPLLWIMVVDSLLRRLDNSGFHTIGYADDIAILITGHFEGVLCDLMGSALTIVENWCTEQGLSINPQKTELVLFTKKTKPGKMHLPTLFGTSL